MHTLTYRYYDEAVQVSGVHTLTYGYYDVAIQVSGVHTLTYGYYDVAVQVSGVHTLTYGYYDVAVQVSGVHTLTYGYYDVAVQVSGVHTLTYGYYDVAVLTALSEWWPGAHPRPVNDTYRPVYTPAYTQDTCNQERAAESHLQTYTAQGRRDYKTNADSNTPKVPLIQNGAVSPNQTESLLIFSHSAHSCVHAKM